MDTAWDTVLLSLVLKITIGVYSMGASYIDTTHKHVFPSIRIDVWVVLLFHATKENKNSFWLTVIYKFILMALIYFYGCLYGNVGGGDNCVLVHIVYGTYNDYYVEGKEMSL